MTAHASEEMAEDYLTIVDVEAAVLSGDITKVYKDDPRGTKYVIEGVACNKVIPVGVVGRFQDRRQFLIITVYEVTPKDS